MYSKALFKGDGFHSRGRRLQPATILFDLSLTIYKQLDMSRPTCCGSKHTSDLGVDVTTLLLILGGEKKGRDHNPAYRVEDPSEDRYHGPEYKVEDPRKLNELRDAGWIAIDISDTNELPLDNWGPVEVKHHLPFNKMSVCEFIKSFQAIFEDFRDCNPIRVIFVSKDPSDFLKVLIAIFPLQKIKDITVLITDKRRIKTPLN